MVSLTPQSGPEHIARLREEIAAPWMADLDAQVSTLIRGNYWLSPESEADPGPYDLDNNPYWSEILDQFNNRNLRELNILKSTQVGGTISTQGGLLAVAVIAPSPAMYVFPTQDEAYTQRDRLYSNALASDGVFRRLVPHPSQWNNKHIDLGGMRIHLAWAGSPQRLRGKPCRIVVFNECDVYKFAGEAGNPVLAGRERTKQFKYTYLIVRESTPVGEHSEVARAADASDMRRWHVQCPHCGAYQDLRFFPHSSGRHIGAGGIVGYRDDSGHFLEPEEARRQAYYLCVRGCRIDPQYKNLLVRGGRWVSDGQWLDNAGTLHGEPSAPDRSLRAYHIWTIMQSKISIGDIAAEFVKHVGDQKRRDFFQNWLGLRFTEHRKPPKWSVLASKLADPGYTWGTVPPQCWFITSAADVQEDRVYWLAVGWAPGRTPFIIDLGRLLKSARLDESFGLDDADEEMETGIALSADLLQLPVAMLHKAWPVAGGGTTPLGMTLVPSVLSGVDSNYRTHEVHEFIRRLGLPQTRLRALRGDDAVSPAERFRMRTLDRNMRDGKPYVGGLTQWQIYRTLYQDNLADRIRAAPGQPGAIRLPSNVLPKGKQMLRQWTNLRKNRKGHYEKISDSLGKDYADLIGYCEALADMVVGDRGWTAEAWSRWRDETLARQARRANRGDSEGWFER